MGKEQEIIDAGRTGNTAVISKIFNQKGKKSTAIVSQITGAIASLRRLPNINCQDLNGDTALHLAALNGHSSTVRLLLELEASPAIPDSRGCLPLHLAAWSGHAHICQDLLTLGPNYSPKDEQNHEGETALLCAAQYSHTKAVQVLLTAGADCSRRNHRGESPLDLACMYGRLDSARLLLSERPELVADVTDTCSPLHLAARNGHQTIVQLLVSCGANINTLTDVGSALHEAAVYGKEEVVTYLLNQGIDVYLRDREDRTALEVLSDQKSQMSLQIGNAILDHLDRLGLSPTKPRPASSFPFPHHTGAAERPVSELYALPDKPAAGLRLRDKPSVTSECSTTSSVAGESPPLPVRQYSRPVSDPIYDVPRPSDRVLQSGAHLGDPNSGEGDLLTPHGSQCPSLGTSPGSAAAAKNKPKKPPRGRKTIRTPPPSVSELPVTQSAQTVSERQPTASPAVVEEPPCIVETDAQDAIFHMEEADSGEYVQLATTRRAGEDGQLQLTGSRPPTAASQEGGGQEGGERLASVASVDSYKDEQVHTDFITFQRDIQAARQSAMVGMQPSSSPRPDSLLVVENRPQPPAQPHKEAGDRPKRTSRDMDTLIESQFMNQTQPDTPSSDQVSSPESCSASSGEQSTQGSQPDQTGYYASGVQLRNKSSTSCQAEGGNENQPSEEEDPLAGLRRGAARGDGLPRVRSLFLEGVCAMVYGRQSMLHTDVTGATSPQQQQQQHAPISSNTHKQQRSDTNPHVEGSDPVPVIHPDPVIDPGQVIDPVPVIDPNAVNQVVLRTTTQHTADTQDSCSQVLGAGIMGNSTSKDQHPTGGVAPFEPLSKGPSSVEKTPQGPSAVEPTSQNETPQEHPSTLSHTTADTTCDVKESVNNDASKNVSDVTDLSCSSDSNAVIGGNETKSRDSDVTPTKETSEECRSHDTSHDSATEKQTVPSSVEVDLKDTQCGSKSPESSVRDPESTRRDPESSRRDPESTRRDPESTRHDPESTRHDPESTRHDPESTRRDPESTRPGPESTRRGQQKSLVMSKSLDEEWAQIEGIVESFGGKMARESVFIQQYEAQFRHMLSESSDVQSVGEWLHGLGLTQYEDLFILHGFDDMQFMGSDVLEVDDLTQMGVTDPDHVTKILAASQRLPPVRCIDAAPTPEYVEEWLCGLGLGEYASGFSESGYTGVESLRAPWELQLNPVMDMVRPGHRKRMLASLRRAATQPNEIARGAHTLPARHTQSGDSHVFVSDNGYLTHPPIGGVVKDGGYITTQSVASDKAALNSGYLTTVARQQSGGGGAPVTHDYLTAYGDGTVVVQVSGAAVEGATECVGCGDRRPVSEEAPPPPTCVRPTPTTAKQRYENDDDSVFPPQAGIWPETGTVLLEEPLSPSSLALRPPEPHAAQWRHRPEVLVRGCCKYNAQYLGFTAVRNVDGVDSTKDAILKLKTSSRGLHKVPSITLSISFTGIKFIDASSKRVVCEHAIGNIFCATQDTDELRYFAYITQDTDRFQHYCHVFRAASQELATEIMLTVGQAFEVTYQLAQLGQRRQLLTAQPCCQSAAHPSCQPAAITPAPQPSCKAPAAAPIAVANATAVYTSCISAVPTSCPSATSIPADLTSAQTATRPSGAPLSHSNAMCTNKTMDFGNVNPPSTYANVMTSVTSVTTFTSNRDMTYMTPLNPDAVTQSPKMTPSKPCAPPRPKPPSPGSRLPTTLPPPNSRPPVTHAQTGGGAAPRPCRPPPPARPSERAKTEQNGANTPPGGASAGNQGATDESTFC